MKRHRARTIILTIVLLLLVAATAWTALKTMRAHAVKTNPKAARAAGKPMPVSTVAVEQGSTESLSGAECVARESRRVALSTEFKFRVKRVETAMGMPVKKDQLLLAFEEATSEKELQNAIQGQVAARSLVGDLEPFLSDVRKLEQTKMISLIDMLRVVEDVGQARLDLIRTSKDVISARHQLEKTEVHAPFDGVVTSLNVDVGTTPQPFSDLVIISRLNPIQLECTFAETDIDTIINHDRIDARFTAYPGQVFPAEFYQILPALKEDTHTLRVLVRLANPEQAFLPGMHAIAKIGRQLEGLRVPAISLIKPASGKANIFVVDLMGTASLRQVEIGDYAQGNVQILKGLVAGERVVVAGQLYLQDGDSVREKNARQAVKNELYPVHDH